MPAVAGVGLRWWYCACGLLTLGVPVAFLCCPCVQVAVLGAAGGIGQPLSMLLKMNPLVSQLSLFDIANTPGVAADLSHCNTPAQARHQHRGAPA